MDVPIHKLDGGLTMGTVDVRKTAFIGAGAGVLLLAILFLIISGFSGESPQIVRPIQFDSSFFGFIGDYLSFFFTTTPGLVVVGITLLFYITGTYYVQKSTSDEHETAALMRGLLIGVCSGMNFVLAYNIYGQWFNQTGGEGVGGALFVLGILAAIKPVSQNDFYQGVIGWINWLAPMSWPVLLLGLVMLVISIIGEVIGLLGVDLFRIGGGPSAHATVKDKIVAANWSTGTFFLVGGLVSNANFQKTAFNMGNIGFIHRNAQHDHREHESGHNLNLFAFGWVVHYLGAVDENIVGYRAQALTELLAESNDSGSGHAKLTMWL